MVVVSKLRKKSILTLDIRERFAISNYTPFAIELGPRERLGYKDSSPLSSNIINTQQNLSNNYHKYMNNCSSTSYGIKISSTEAILNL